MDIPGDTMLPFEFENCVALGLVTDDSGSFSPIVDGREMNRLFCVSQWHELKNFYKVEKVAWYNKE
jgi:hypothetical protein